MEARHDNVKTVPEEKKDAQETKQISPKVPQLLVLNLKEALQSYDQIKSMTAPVFEDHEDIKKLRALYETVLEQKLEYLTAPKLWELIEIIRLAKPSKNPNKITPRSFALNLLKKNLEWDLVQSGIEKLKQFYLDTPENLMMICTRAKMVSRIVAIFDALHAVNLSNSESLNKVLNLVEKGIFLGSRLPNAIRLLHENTLATQENLMLLLHNSLESHYIVNMMIKLRDDPQKTMLSKILKSKFVGRIAYIIDLIPFVLNQDQLQVLLNKSVYSQYFIDALVKLSWKVLKQSFTSEDLKIFFQYPQHAKDYVTVINKLAEATPSLLTTENMTKLRYYAANSGKIYQLLNNKVTQTTFDNAIKEVISEMKTSFLLGIHSKETKREDCNPSHIYKFFGDKDKVPNNPIGDLKPIGIIFKFL